MAEYTGNDVKLFILNSGVLLWKVAEKLGITDGTFSRRLRKSFTAAEFEQIKTAVEAIKAEQK